MGMRARIFRIARDAGCELAFADDFDWRKMMLPWISCKDRMPEDGEFFLAYGENLGNYVGGPSIDICRWDGQLWSEGGTELVSEVDFTHWMPLPSAPVACVDYRLVIQKKVNNESVFVKGSRNDTRTAD